MNWDNIITAAIATTPATIAAVGAYVQATRAHAQGKKNGAVGKDISKHVEYLVQAEKPSPQREG